MNKFKKSPRTSILLAVFPLIILSVPSYAMKTDTGMSANDEEAIRETAQLYVDGVKYADKSKIDEAFHQDWNMTGFYAEGDYETFDRSEFIQLIERNRENADSFPRYEGGIVDVQHHDKVAVVKINLENDRVIFTDYLSLLEIDGQWKIIHKIWDTERK